MWNNIRRLRAALGGLLREMSLDYTLPSYDVYKVTKGAVDRAREALAGAAENGEGSR